MADWYARQRRWEFLQLLLVGICWAFVTAILPVILR